MARIPLWLKITWSVWLLAWAPAYAMHYGAHAFLWFCDISNFALGVALWTGSRLLFSWQAVSVLLVQLVWCFDLASRLLFGVHPAGATYYMFDPAIPLPIRLLSLFHVAAAALMIWALWKFGYDRRAFLFQTATAAAVLPLSWLAGARENLNWTWGLFRENQAWMSPLAYLGLCMLAYPLVLFLPAHLLFAYVWPRRSTGRGPAPTPRGASS